MRLPHMVPILRVQLLSVFSDIQIVLMNFNVLWISDARALKKSFIVLALSLSVFGFSKTNKSKFLLNPNLALFYHLALPG